MQQMKSFQKVIVEKQITLEEFLHERGLNATLFFVSKDGKVMQNTKEVLKIGDTVSIIAKVSGGKI